MQIYLVGGAVRDELLQLPVQERDWVVVGATPAQMEQLGYRLVGQSFPVFLHPQTQEEYALARTEQKHGQGYKGFTVNANPQVTLEEDLLRRDLTINALAKDKHGNLIDPYGGQQDIQLKLLRAVSPAFSEDPLRVLRVARFAARFAHLGFQIEASTEQLMRQLTASGELLTLTKERVWVEVEKALACLNPEVFWQVLTRIGAIQELWPALAAQLHQQPRNLDWLRLSAQTTTSAKVKFSLPQRFCTLALNADPDLIAALTQQLLLPKAYQRLMQAVIALEQHPALTQLSAAGCMDMFNQLDAWRQPETFSAALELMQLTHKTTQAAKLLELLQQARALNAQQLLQQGLKGPALGQELAKVRQAKLQQLITG